jgi:hypothetical protein
MPPVAADAGRWNSIAFTTFTLLEWGNIKGMSASHICADFTLGSFQAKASNKFSGLGEMDLSF